jgi:hypothetical protein
MNQAIAAPFESPARCGRGGHVYMMHASICRTDTAAVQAEDIIYVLGSLQTRVYDPLGNLKKGRRSNNIRTGRKLAVSQRAIPQCGVPGEAAAEYVNRDFSSCPRKRASRASASGAPLDPRLRAACAGVTMPAVRCGFDIRRFTQRGNSSESAMRKLASVAFLWSALWAVSASAEEATKLRKEIAVPVDYQGRQIQLTGWFEKPIGAGPFPVVIALHSCAGYTYGGGALRLWVPFLQGQGYATFKLDSFTARGYSEVCATQAVTAADRAPDVLAAAARCCRTPGRQARLYRGDRLVAWRRHRGLRRARLLGIATIAGATGGSRR